MLVCSKITYEKYVGFALLGVLSRYASIWHSFRRAI